jgi:tetratricopeptide (TPR) repeat protein
MQRTELLFFVAALVFVATPGCVYSYPASAASIGGAQLPCLGDHLPSDRTILACTEALRRNPRDAKFLLRRGAAWTDMGDYDFAIGDFSRAIRLTPQSASAYFNRGVAREKRGELEESLVDFKRSGELNPSDPEVQQALERVTAAIAAKQAPKRLSDAFAEQPINLAGLDWEESTGPSGAAIKTSGSVDEELLLLAPTVLLVASAGVVALVARRRTSS